MAHTVPTPQSIPHNQIVADVIDEYFSKGVEFVRARPDMEVQLLAEEFVNLILPHFDELIVQSKALLGMGPSRSIQASFEVETILREEMKEFFTVVRANPQMNVSQLVASSNGKPGEEKQSVGVRKGIEVHMLKFFV